MTTERVPGLVDDRGNGSEGRTRRATKNSRCRDGQNQDAKVGYSGATCERRRGRRAEAFTTPLSTTVLYVLYRHCTAIHAELVDSIEDFNQISTKSRITHSLTRVLYSTNYGELSCSTRQVVLLAQRLDVVNRMPLYSALF